MEYIIALMIILACSLSVNIAIKSYSSAKKKGLLESEVVVSKEFYIKSCELCDIMTNSESMEYQRKNLPKALSALEKEVNQSRRINIEVGNDIEVNRIF